MHVYVHVCIHITPFVGWNKSNLISVSDLKKKRRKANHLPPADQCSASVIKNVVYY